MTENATSGTATGRQLVCERCREAEGEFVVPTVEIPRPISGGTLTHEEPAVLCEDCREYAEELGYTIEWPEEEHIPEKYKAGGCA